MYVYVIAVCKCCTKLQLQTLILKNVILMGLLWTRVLCAPVPLNKRTYL